MGKVSVAKLIKELSWTEKELPQRERTKHVHSLHQYVGKFVPQLVDYFLQRDLKKSKLICDPFMDSIEWDIEAQDNSLKILITPVKKDDG